MADLTLPQLCESGGADDAVVLCASAGLARRLRAAHGRAQAARGLAQWRALATGTVAQWLGHVVGAAVLAGEVPQASARRVALDAAQERLLWERVIEADAAGDEALFDREGLAQAAAQANGLIEGWGLRLDADEQGEETAAFLRWRAAFRALLDASDWLEPARHVEWQIGCIARGVGRLPPRVAFAGFDRFQPQEERLRRALAGRGVDVLVLDLSRPQPATAVTVALPDAASECRAAAAWAAQRLEANPAARVGIVAPELGALRATLTDALDAALHPAAFSPAQAEMPRCYEFSLGTPLSSAPLVETALALLALASNPQRVEQARLGELLRRPYWAADGEADARDGFDAALREWLAPQIALERALRLARRLAAKGVVLTRTLTALEALQQAAAAQPARRLPSDWAGAFAGLTAAAGWPGDRPLSGAERQAQNAFVETLEALGRFDGLLGRVGFGEALRRLQQLCRERPFQPEAGDARVQVADLLEAAAEPFDALWVMGMNDHAWPLPARPNPLLPAALQRRARTPGASAQAQAELAQALQRRLLHSASEAVFSWATNEGGRELRPSPLLAGLPVADATGFSVPPGSIERFAASASLVRLDDAQAPPLVPGEPARGGTALLKAQAVCPAWAFYQYRLGARSLGEPVSGLAPAERGTLLHGVLEHFWRAVGSSAALAALDDAALASAAGTAADAALAAFGRDRDEALSPRFAALERERLIRLAVLWLGFERGRPAPFRVAACEKEIDIEIEGLAVRLVVDRIDELADGRQLVIDYKTAAVVSAKSWNDPRIAEPQLPVYAALAARGGIAGTAFAQVRAEKCAFVGITADEGVLPDVAGIGESDARKLFPAVAEWNVLLEHWRTSLGAIAREIRAGVAAVQVSDEAALAHCQVKPLLRLAEAQQQRERAS